jgi:hypothetical protein
MSLRTFRFSGKQRLLAVGATIVALVAVATVVLFMSLHTKTAFGSATGAGICTPNTPICTENGASAFAIFDNISSDGCIYTQVVVEPTSSLSYPGSNASQSVFVFISKYDQCNSVQLEAGTNNNLATGYPEFTGAIEFGANMSTGSVNGTAPIYDQYTGALLYTASINVTWQGYGSTTRNIDNEHFFSQDTIMNLHINGVSRNAKASGMFTDETGSNVITGPTLHAVLFDSTGSQVLIFRS